MEDGIEETLIYCDFPRNTGPIRTNNVIEKTKPGDPPPHSGSGQRFPDGNSRPHAGLPGCAMAGTQWGNKKYMNMKHLEAAIEDASIAG